MEDERDIKMIQDLPVTLCIRCGKQRVVVSTQKETINGSTIITTLTACPDADCQKKVEDQFEKERIDREKFSESKFPLVRGKAPKVAVKAH